VCSPPMSGWTSLASSVSGNCLKRFVRGSMNCSRCRSGRLVRRGFCHAWWVCRGVRSDALRNPPCIPSSPSSRGLGGLCSLRESGRCWFCAQPERRCPCLPHFQHRLVCLGASGGVTVGLTLDKTAIAHVSMVIRRSVAASREREHRMVKGNLLAATALLRFAL